MLAALADDLDAPRALAAVDRWVAATLGTDGLADTSDPRRAPVAMLAACSDAALGPARSELSRARRPSSSRRLR